MSSRQHTPLILTSPDGAARLLPPLALQRAKAEGGYGEAWLQDLVFTHPEAIPVGEIDPSFGPLIPICTELDTRSAGFADALYLNPLGMPTLVECKLWRNPEARREVVGQILDYARVLRRWTYADLQREAARATKQQGFDLTAHMRERGKLPDLDEAAFIDGVTRNLAQGRIMLLVLGDGIREGVEAIADYIQGTTGLHFTFGLVEAQVFDLGEDRWIVQPRVLAKTLIVSRTVIDVVQPNAVSVKDTIDAPPTVEATVPLNERGQWMMAFWTEMLNGLQLDDAEQRFAKPLAQGYVTFPFAAGSDLWLHCRFYQKDGTTDVYLGSTGTNPLARAVLSRLENEQDAITAEIGLPVRWTRSPDDKVSVECTRHYGDLSSSTVRESQIIWFRTTINAFTNALRPRISTLVRELKPTISRSA